MCSFRIWYDYRLRSYGFRDIEDRNIKKLLSLQKKYQNLYFQILLMVALIPAIYGVFLRSQVRSFWFFAFIIRKCKKWAIFDILITIILRVNMITRQMSPFFSSNLWALSVGIFHFRISRRSKFSSMGSIQFPLCIIFWSLKYNTFKLDNIDIHFSVETLLTLGI